MFAAAEAMEFERAAAIRDRIEQMRESVGKPVDAVQEREPGGRKGKRARKKKDGDPAAVERPRAAAEAGRVVQSIQSGRESRGRGRPGSLRFSKRSWRSWLRSRRARAGEDAAGDQAVGDAVDDVGDHFAAEPDAVEDVGRAVGEDAGGADEAEDEPAVGARAR